MRGVALGMASWGLHGAKHLLRDRNHQLVSFMQREITLGTLQVVICGYSEASINPAVLENLIKTERCSGNKFNSKLRSPRYTLTYRKWKSPPRLITVDFEH